MSRLDPEILAMSVENAARWRPPQAEPTIAHARTSYTERYFERSLPASGEIFVRRLSIPGPAGAIAARAYRPARIGAVAAPLVIYFHGGGFVLGEADGYERQSMRLAEQVGCVVLFAEFRLAPEHPFPAAVEDAISIVEWSARQAAIIGVDRRRIILAGDSAGGNLAANACLAVREHHGPAIAFQCLLYPLVDFRPYCGGPTYPSVEAFSQGYLLDRAVMEWFTRHYLTDPAQAQDARASPILAADLRDLPPAAVITAECDPLRDMGAEYAKRLAACGAAVEYRCMAGLAHNFMGHVARCARAREAFDAVAEILRRAVVLPAL